MTDSWTHSAANDDGFVVFSKIKSSAQAMDLGSFLDAFPLPALLSIDKDQIEKDQADSGIRRFAEPLDRGVQLLTERIEGATILRYLGKVAFLAKRPGNPFPHLVSIGRSRANDITLTVDSVSKVHGYFVADGKTWGFTDHGSTNGSRIGGKRLTQGVKVPLTDGAVLQLGFDVCFRFLMPPGLYRAAHDPQQF